MKTTFNTNINIANFGIKMNISKAIKDSAGIVKQSIASEFKKPKTGVRNIKNQYEQKRSSLGESLAKDSGDSLKNLEIQNLGTSAIVGIVSFGTDYVKAWEKERPTMQPAADKSLQKIEEIFTKNLKK